MPTREENRWSKQAALTFMEDYQRTAYLYRDPWTAVRWFLLNAHLPQPITPSIAAMWASQNYLPEEARPLIAAGEKPWQAARNERSAIDAAGGQDAYRRAQVRRLADQGMVIDPDADHWLEP